MSSRTATVTDRLRELLPPGGVLADPEDVAGYAADWRHTVNGRPLCVVRPRTTQEVSAILRLCHEAGVATVPQGGNTGLAAGAVPDSSGTQIVLSLSRMSAIRSIDPLGMTMELEAGCVLKTAQIAAQEVNRLLPVSLAAEGTAQIGGIVSTNAGGLNVLRYGMTRQLVLGLEVVRFDGEVINGLRHLRKDNAGYDWKQLFIGSEGTLGIVTAAVLRLVPRPKDTATSLVSVPDPARALQLLNLLQNELGDAICAFELISRASMDLVLKHFGLSPPIAEGDWFVLCESSSNLSGLRDAMEVALGMALEHGFALDAVLAESGAQAAQLWTFRERVTEAELKEGPSLKHDVSVPIPCIPAFLAEAAAAVGRDFPGARVNAFGHGGDGNIHFNVLTNANHDKSKITRTVHNVVAAYNGSISAEHGIGSYRVEEYLRYRSRSEIALAELIKRSIDPSGLLNPGKIFLT